MKYSFKKLPYLILVVLFMTNLSFVGLCQDNGVIGTKPPDNQLSGNSINALDGVDPGCDVLDPGCPIDGGLSALLVLGVGYGMKKARDARKINKIA